MDQGFWECAGVGVRGGGIDRCRLCLAADSQELEVLTVQQGSALGPSEVSVLSWDFKVLHPLVVTRLGVFPDGPTQQLHGNITVKLFQVDQEASGAVVTRHIDPIVTCRREDRVSAGISQTGAGSAQLVNLQSKFPSSYRLVKNKTKKKNWSKAEARPSCSQGDLRAPVFKVSASMKACSLVPPAGSRGDSSLQCHQHRHQCERSVVQAGGAIHPATGRRGSAVAGA